MRGYILIGVIILLLVSIPSASAYASDFLENKTAIIAEGEQKEYCVYLQNPSGQVNHSYQALIFDGEEDIIDNLEEVEGAYSVPIGTVSDDFPVCMNLKLPWYHLLFSHDKRYEFRYTVPQLNQEQFIAGRMINVQIQVWSAIYVKEEITEDTETNRVYRIIQFIKNNIHI